jgi:hypothetical protein
LSFGDKRERKQDPTTLLNSKEKREDSTFVLFEGTKVDLRICCFSSKSELFHGSQIVKTQHGRNKVGEIWIEV